MMITTTNLVLLDAGLKERFQKLFRAEKRNTVALAKEAFQIHGEHYHVAERKYDKDFEKWWTTQAMDRVFGTRTNWTKWHRAGEAISMRTSTPSGLSCLSRACFWAVPDRRGCPAHSYRAAAG